MPILVYKKNKIGLRKLDEDLFEFKNDSNAISYFDAKTEQDDLLNLCSCLFKVVSEFNFSLDSKKRNLVYFTVGYSKEYIDLLKCCIFSIVFNCKDLSNVDFLLITDDKQSFDEVSKTFPDLNLNYLVFPKAKDGVEASMNKLKVFEYKNIFKYKKILFLDADIVLNNDVNQIFNLDIQDHKIYSLTHEGCGYEVHNSKYHNITRYTKEKINRLTKLKIKPFNAGQFLMLSSVGMARHFTNIKYITDLWQKDYFFEQSFLNTYFNYNEAANTSLLEDYFSIYYIAQHKIESLKIDKSKNIHYAGDPCNGSTKLEFLKSEFPNYYGVLA